MAVQLRFIGQSSMDLYYRDFKGNTGFFELDDFIFRAATTVADYYQKTYEQKYQELRQTKSAKDELVGVDQDLLSSQELEFKDNIATLLYPVMSFLYDKSNVGYQFLLPIQPSDVKFERASLDEVWQFDYLPKSNRIFWLPQQGKIRLQKNSTCTIQKAELLYIPSVIDKTGKVFGEAMVADGVAAIAINQTVAAMKGLSDSTIVKESLDGNENKTIQTEVNPKAVR
jgi:hypothetical protein